VIVLDASAALELLLNTAAAPRVASILGNAALVEVIR